MYSVPGKTWHGYGHRMDIFFKAITIRGGVPLEPLEPPEPHSGDTHLSRHTGIKIRSTCIASMAGYPGPGHV